MRQWRTITLIASVAASASFGAVMPLAAEDRSQARSMVISQYGIVAAEQPIAARAGTAVLEAGGNAIDAAVAASDICIMAGIFWNFTGFTAARSCWSRDIPYLTLPRGLLVAQTDAGYIRRMSEKRARTALTSGGLEPVVDAGGNAGHSVFAGALIDVLMGNTGVMDGQDLFAQISGPVTVNAPQTPVYGDVRFAGHDGGDFIFVRKD